MQRLAFLVVEDDESVRRVLVRGLSSHGDVEAVGTCAAARVALRSRKFDALLVDVNLPDGQGFSVIELGRVRHPHLWVLVVTGSTDHDVVTRTLEHDARYMLKPLDDRHMAIIVDEVRARRTARERRTRVVIERWTIAYALTPAEVELLELGVRGLNREAIGRERSVSPETVRKQVQGLLRKTVAETFEGVVSRVLREAVAEPE